jgi:hypothetical protein
MKWKDSKRQDKEKIDVKSIDIACFVLEILLQQGLKLLLIDQSQ